MEKIQRVEWLWRSTRSQGMGLGNGKQNRHAVLNRGSVPPPLLQLLLCQTNLHDITQLSIISRHNRSNRPTDLKWVSSETVTGKLYKEKRLANSDTGFKYKSG